MPVFLPVKKKFRDPHWNNVVLLAGVYNNSIRDTSNYGVTLSPTASVTVDSTVTRFPGQSSMRFSGTGAYIDVPYTTAKFGFNTIPAWTVEAWVYFQTSPANVPTYRLDVVGNAGSVSGWEAAITTSGGGISVTYPGTGGAGAGQQLAAGQWYHLVWQRSSSTVYTFGINGVVVNSVSYGRSGQNENFLKIGGNYNNSVNMTYNIQELRLTAGVSRYPTTQGTVYTLPNSYYPRR